MRVDTTITFILLSCWDLTTATENQSLTIQEEFQSKTEQALDVHSRRKRYVVFPKGTSLQLLLEGLVHVPTQFEVVIGPTLQIAWPLPPGDGRTKRSLLPGEKSKLFGDVSALLDSFGMTVGLAWQLPDDPMIYQEFKKKHKIYKRNVLRKVEAFMKPGGVNGRECVLKALCESGQRTPSKKDFLKEILHKIFSVEGEEDDDEHPDDKIYRKAHQSTNQNCQTLYPECQFSIFNEIQ